MALIVFHDDEKERDKGLENDVGNSAGPDDGQFDKTRWSIVLGGSVADRCIPYAASTLYHTWNGSVPKLSGRPNWPLMIF